MSTEPEMPTLDHLVPETHFRQVEYHPLATWPEDPCAQRAFCLDRAGAYIGKPFRMKSDDGQEPDALADLTRHAQGILDWINGIETPPAVSEDPEVFHDEGTLFRAEAALTNDDESHSFTTMEAGEVFRRLLNAGFLIREVKYS